VSKYVLIAVLGLSLAACAGNGPTYEQAKAEFAATGKTSWTPKNRDGSPAKGPLCTNKASTNYTFPNSEVCK
jgi:predicted small lipoprotein YifL